MALTVAAAGGGTQVTIDGLKSKAKKIALKKNGKVNVTSAESIPSNVVSNNPIYQESESIVYKNELYVISTGNYYAKWDGTQWSTYSNKPKTYSGYRTIMTAVINNLIYYLAAGDYCYAFNGSVWTAYPAVTVAKSSGSLSAQGDNCMYICSDRKLYKYDGNATTYLGALPDTSKTYTRCLRYVNGALYITCYGGYTYKFLNGSYTQIATLPNATNYNPFHLVTLNAHLYVIGLGGYDTPTSDVLTGAERMSDVYEYNFNKNVWNLTGKTPNLFYGGSAQEYNNELHMLGGSLRDSSNHYPYKTAHFVMSVDDVYKLTEE